MGQPKKRRSPRKQGLHRQHLVRKLAERVNSRSPVKVQLGKKKARQAPAASPKAAAKSSK